MDERFENYLSALLAGEKVTIAADDRYGDFLKYVEAKGGEILSIFIEQYERNFQQTNDEAIPTVVEMWLDKKHKQ